MCLYIHVRVDKYAENKYNNFSSKFQFFNYIRRNVNFRKYPRFTRFNASEIWTASTMLCS